jgi:hypothetical protein
MKENYPIFVIQKNVGYSVSDTTVHESIEFVINPSAIAMVFPVIQVGQGDEVVEEGEETTEPEISDLVDTYVGSTNKDGLIS